MDRKKQKQPYCKNWHRKNRCKSRWTARRRSRRTVRVWIGKVGTEVNFGVFDEF